jgi:Glycosyltransferase family 9 (heptosyltransferase)
LGNTCNELLEYCLRGEPWPDDLLDQALTVDDGRTFLSVVVERLGDLFEPRLCETYNRLFTQVILRITPELTPRIRKPAELTAPPASASRVYVLSRVTLGADVAVTSVLLDAAKRRYPNAEIVFVGPRKSYDLFEADSRVKHLAAPYARSGTLKERLRASASLWIEGGIVIDPDSRLSQLGLISVCDERNYCFFPSRAYGADRNEPLAKLAAQWAREVFGVEGARPYVAPLSSAEPPADITVSLGVGENAAKRLDDAQERALLRALADTGASILVDKGGSPEERERVERALLPGMRTHHGAFAPFAAQIARSKLFVGYDSAGGHVASACGVPLISIAKGFVTGRMAARWRPDGIVLSEGEVGEIPELARRILNT